jgi:hypothetical protein
MPLTIPMKVELPLEDGVERAIQAQGIESCGTRDNRAGRGKVSGGLTLF